MKPEEFIKLFSEQFDETPEDTFTMDVDFKSLDEWSSLTALSIIAMVDEEYDKRLTGAELRSVKTIGELYQLIESK